MKASRIHLSFGIVTAITIVLCALRGGESLFANGLIGTALIVCFWWWSRKSEAAWPAVLASQALILLFALGYGLRLEGWSLAGVTYDTYLHLVAAFVATMLAAAYFRERMPERKALLWAGLLILGLGLAVEAVQVIGGLVFRENSLATHLASCLEGFCWYWQDTAKDVINDALGIVLFLLGQRPTGEKAGRERKREQGRDVPTRKDESTRRDR